MHPTTPAPAEVEQTSSDVVPGTIGFELYLAALQIPRAVLIPPQTPKEAVK